MNEEFNTTKGGLTNALNGTNSALKASILAWLSNLTDGNGQPAGDDDVVVIKHPPS